MNTRKAILSAMSFVASISMFAASPAPAKETKAEVAPAVQKAVETTPYAENGHADEISAKRDENAAAVAGVMTALTPAYKEKEKAKEEAFEEQIKTLKKRGANQEMVDALTGTIGAAQAKKKAQAEKEYWESEEGAKFKKMLDDAEEVYLKRCMEMRQKKEAEEAHQRRIGLIKKWGMAIGGLLASYLLIGLYYGRTKQKFKNRQKSGNARA